MVAKTYFSWNWRNPGLTWGLAFSREVVAKGEAARLGTDAGIWGIWGMVEASCFQASSVGAEGRAAGFGVGTSRAGALAMVAEAADGDEGASEALFSVAVEKGDSELLFTVPPSVRKWKLQNMKPIQT